MPPIVPSPDVLPLPAPIWLLEFLLVFTFIAHVLPMNFLFGGSILAAISHKRGGKDPHHMQLAQRIYKLLPTVVAFTVTLGVAPLLFVQVLYGQLVYSSSILMANSWFLVIGEVIVAYYLIYLLRFKWETLAGMRMGIVWLVALIVAVIGFTYSNNFTLMLRPESWAAHYFANPASGSLNWSDPTLYPRYLHMLVGALAVAGLWIMLLGWRRKSSDAEWSGWAVTYGAKMFMHATLLNVLIGLWFLMALPKAQMMIYMGGNMVATILLTLSFVLTALAWFMIRKVSKSPAARGPALLGSAVVFVILVAMAIMRQQLRTSFLEPYFRLEGLQVAPQWDVFGMFAITLVIGLVVVAWLIRAVMRAKPADLG
jgi:hypothetical protein